MPCDLLASDSRSSPIIARSRSATFAVARAATIRLGVSSCLLGEAVRYDGGHKRDPIVRSTCSAASRNGCRSVPSSSRVSACRGRRCGSCATATRVRLVEIASGRDHTRALERWTAARLRSLRALDLCGYVLKKDSPSCGMERVKLYRAAGGRSASGVGDLCARVCARRSRTFPSMDEGQLRDPRAAREFIERAFAYARVRALFRGRWKIADVAAFHAAQRARSSARARPPAAGSSRGWSQRRGRHAARAAPRPSTRRASWPRSRAARRGRTRACRGRSR